MVYNTKGYHLIAELYNCQKNILYSTEDLLDICERACKIADMEVIKSYGHKFKIDENKYGSSIFIILQESHLSLHTWPEKKYAALDIYICGEKNKNKPDKALEYIIQEIDFEWVHVSELERGIFDGENYIHKIFGWEERNYNKGGRYHENTYHHTKSR